MQGEWGAPAGDPAAGAAVAGSGGRGLGEYGRRGRERPVILLAAGRRLHRGRGGVAPDRRSGRQAAVVEAFRRHLGGDGGAGLVDELEVAEPGRRRGG